MSAGTGVRHSEFNASDKEIVHFLQIWIIPREKGLAPGYEQKHFSEAERRGQLRLIGSADGTDGSVLIHQDARIYASLLDHGASARLAVSERRRLYVHVARGSIVANGIALAAGDAVKLTAVNQLELAQPQAAEVLVFDLPGESG